MRHDGNPAGSPLPTPNADRYKFLVVVMTVFTTITTAVVASLQADANIRASSTNIASQQYAIQVSNELQRQGLQSAYDFNLLSGYLQDAQEATVYQMTALEQEATGDIQGAEASRVKAEVAQARADKARQLSIFFNDPRYAPETTDGLPDAEGYLADSFTGRMTWSSSKMPLRMNTTAGIPRQMPIRASLPSWRWLSSSLVWRRRFPRACGYCLPCLEWPPWWVP